VATLIVSDVPGDDPAFVASGPTVPIAGSRAEVRHLVALHGIALPPAAAALLAGSDNPPPRPDDPRFARNSVEIIASSALSLEAAARGAEQRGLAAHILSDAVEREVDMRNRPFRRPAVLLSGGETTVTVRGRGKGGRNAEFLLAFALAIEGGDNSISAIAAIGDLVVTGPTGTNVNDFRAIVIR